MITDTYKPQINGVVSSVESLSKELARQGHEVTVFCPGKKNKIITENGHKICFLKARFKVPTNKDYHITLLSLLRFRKLVRKERIQVFHNHSPFAPVGMAALMESKFLRKPTVGTYHTYLPEYLHYFAIKKLAGVVKRIGEPPAWLLTRLIYNQCDITTTTTNEMRKEISKRGVKSIFIPNGLDTKKFYKAFSKKESRKAFKLSHDKTVFGFIGRIGLEKKLEVLLEAFKEFDEEACLVIAGFGSQEKHYKKLAKKIGLKNVVFPGKCKGDKVLKFYNAIDVFVSPSDTETQGLTYLEAMAAEVPVIGSNKRGSKELVNNKNGLQFRAGSSKDLAKKMRVLMNNTKLRERKGRGGREFANRFSIENVAREFLQTYKKAIEINNKNLKKIK